MIERSRHVPLRPTPWNAADVATAIEEIASDARAHFHPDRFWPAHPLDEGIASGHTSFYCGATGMIWALDYLHQTGASRAPADFRPVLPRLIDANKSEFTSDAYQEYAAHGSLLFGDMGTALLAMRLDPSPGVADAIYARANANMGLPTRELMWGLPGSMLACLHMIDLTDEQRWRAEFAAQAERLLGELEETADGPLWTQDLYGQRLRYLGPVHGFAGNMIALMRGWDYLTEEQRARIVDAVPRTLGSNAWRSELGASWCAAVDDDGPPRLCQHCHGAPGMVTSFAGAPFTSPGLEELLLEGGKFTWAAGPLAKGSNLCHGTGGNGYAFLKLYHRTHDDAWLDRARSFAMTAIAQCRELRNRVGRGRYSLWTGDVGLAIFLSDCLSGEARFPTIDVF
jgi:hypothetical protein